MRTFNLLFKHTLRDKGMFNAGGEALKVLILRDKDEDLQNFTSCINVPLSLRMRTFLNFYIHTLIPRITPGDHLSVF